MKNNIVRYITFTVALVLIVSSRPFAQTTNTSDESEIKKFEIGGQITVLRQRSYEDDSQVFDVNFPGVGP